jgi:ssDNA-binding Zn-finger/Zn-ribbon topoisomerase 1
VILKEKEFTNPSDPKLRAGEEAEKQLAHYLKRAFKKRDNCFVINDLRITHDGETAQIDHLIVSPYGLVIIESKSCHSTIIVDEYNRWARTFNSKPEGMQSPVLQAEEQGKIIKELLRANDERLLGKMLMGSVQRGFGYCPFLVYVSVSDSGIIEQKIDVPELYKADEVAKAISDKLDELKKKSDLLSPKFWLTSADGWRMKLSETNVVAEFLVSQHQLKCQVLSEKENNKKISPRPNVMPKQSETTFVPKVGASCPECGKQKLIRKSINRSDGTETDFLACQGYPSACRGLFPLVALSGIQREYLSASHVAKESPHSTSVYIEGGSCPSCKEGKLVKRKAKTEFLGCSNFPKCKFTDYRNQPVP